MDRQGRLGGSDVARMIIAGAQARRRSLRGAVVSVRVRFGSSVGLTERHRSWFISVVDKTKRTELDPVREVRQRQATQRIV